MSEPTVEELEQAENRALKVVIGWAALLAYIVGALLFTDALWGPVVGFVLWSVGARGVVRSFSEAAARTADARARTSGSSEAV